MSTTVNPYLEGNFAPVHEEVTANGVAGQRSSARGPQRALPSQRAQPSVAARARHLPLVLGRRHGARDPAARRTGRVVPQPMGAIGRRRARTRRGATPWSGACRHGLRTEHERHRPCGTHVRPRGSRCAPLRAERRTGHDRTVRLRRHPRGRLHRPPEAAIRSAASSTQCPTSSDGATTSRSRSSTRGRGCGRSRHVTMGGPVSVHDTAVTQRSIVLLDLPVTFSLDAVAEGALFPYRWQDGYHTARGPSAP